MTRATDLDITPVCIEAAGSDSLDFGRTGDTGEPVAIDSLSLTHEGLGRGGRPVGSWTFEDGWPSKYAGPAPGDDDADAVLYDLG